MFEVKNDRKVHVGGCPQPLKAQILSRKMAMNLQPKLLKKEFPTKDPALRVRG